jgi:hypothetical protein
MASGGYRAGAGRPRKPESDLSRPRQKKPTTKANSAPVSSQTGDLTPLEYALKVMNDATQCPERRDRFCIALLPYFHSKMGELGKKDHANKTTKLANESGRFKASVTPLFK